MKRVANKQLETRLPPADLALPLLLLFVMAISGYDLTRPQVVPDFSQAPTVTEKKASFFAYLKPYIDQENERIQADRQRVQGYLTGTPSLLDRVHLRRMRLQYLSANDSPENILGELLLRIDEVPASLALIQAAKESGWGSSRFARIGFNFFGQQCFQSGCGFTPRKRTSGLRHEVAKFRTTREAVRSYIHNLNTHDQYETLRTIRADARAAKHALSGIALSAGLERYSERGMAYVEEVQAMIRANNLE